MTYRVVTYFKTAGFGGEYSGSTEFSTKDEADRWERFAKAQPNVLFTEQVELPHISSAA